MKPLLACALAGVLLAQPRRGAAPSAADDRKVVSDLEARSTDVVYEHQEDTQQTVRLWGSTAVVTALLWVKGTDKGKPFDYKLWFSDTYVLTRGGWRFVFGKASIPLPASP